MSRVVTVVLLVAAAAAAAAVANFALLRYASTSSDPVGKLRVHTRLPAAPATVIRPQTGPLERENADD